MDRKSFYSKLIPLTIILGISFGISRVGFPGLSEAGHRVLGIFVFAALAWTTEVIPLAATGAAIVFLESLFLSGPLGIEKGYKLWMSSFASSTIVLFAGGYFLAVAMKRYSLDVRIAGAIMMKAGQKPGGILFGIMATCAFLSMWMSNTATTALMMAVVLPIANRFDKNEKFVTALLLGIPFAANIGGIATPIGTPPNAIAISNLAAAGIRITFTEWMIMALPIALALLFIVWRLLLAAFPPGKNNYSVEIPDLGETAFRGKVVFGVFIITALLWLTESLHGINSAVIAMIPPIFLVGSGIIDREDIQAVGWDILILVGGGIALGTAMQRSGFSEWLLALLPLSKSHSLVVMLVFGFITLIGSNFMSNSATANIMIPLVLGLSGEADNTLVAVAVAFCASCAMALPVSTPPNAIAYGSGLIKLRDMAKIGAIIGLISLIFVTIAIYFIGNLIPGVY